MVSPPYPESNIPLGPAAEGNVCFMLSKDYVDVYKRQVLKMLAIGGEGDVIDSLMEMNIAPLAISYEYDPCDFLKARCV